MRVFLGGFLPILGRAKCLTITPALLWAEENVIDCVCYMHKCPISSWTAVNPTTVTLQRCSHGISQPVCLEVETQKNSFQNDCLYCEATINSAITNVSHCKLLKISLPNIQYMRRLSFWWITEDSVEYLSLHPQFWTFLKPMY